MAQYQNITPINIAQAAITTSYATIYTTSTSSRVFVKDIDIVNSTSSAINIYVSLVPSGGTAGTDNAIFYANALPANTTVQWCGSQIMNAGTTIQVKASAVGCTITVSGGEAV